MAPFQHGAIANACLQTPPCSARCCSSAALIGASSPPRPAAQAPTRPPRGTVPHATLRWLRRMLFFCLTSSRGGHPLSFSLSRLYPPRTLRNSLTEAARLSVGVGDRPLPAGCPMQRLRMVRWSPCPSPPPPPPLLPAPSSLLRVAGCYHRLACLHTQSINGNDIAKARPQQRCAHVFALTSLPFIAPGPLKRRAGMNCLS